MANDTWHRWQSYLVLHDRFTAMAQHDDDAALASFYRGEMRADFDRFMGALLPLIRFHADEARGAADAVGVVVRSARAWILGLVTIMALLFVCRHGMVSDPGVAGLDRGHNGSDAPPGQAGNGRRHPRHHARR